MTSIVSRWNLAVNANISYACLYSSRFLFYDPRKQTYNAMSDETLLQDLKHLFKLKVTFTWYRSLRFNTIEEMAEKKLSKHEFHVCYRGCWYFRFFLTNHVQKVTDVDRFSRACCQVPLKQATNSTGKSRNWKMNNILLECVPAFL